MAGQVFEEKDLRFDFEQAIAARKFDDENRIGTECQSSSIDFIVELSDSLLFIEVKYPGHPNAIQNIDDNIYEFESGRLVRTLAKNCRDSFFVEHVSCKIYKPITFIAIVEFGDSYTPNFSPQMDELRKCLFIDQQPDYQENGFLIEKCNIMGLDRWNKLYSNFPVTRQGHIISNTSVRLLIEQFQLVGMVVLRNNHATICNHLKKRRFLENGDA